MAVNIGPKIGIDGEKEYRKQINDLITQQKTFSAEMKELESSFDKNTSAMEKNRKKSELLTKQVANQEKQVSELEKGLAAAEEKYGENAAETNKWRQAVSNAKTELSKLKTDLDKIPSSLSTVGDTMQKAGQKMQSVGKTLTTHVTAPLTAMGAASIAAWNEVDDAMDTVVKKTGATGEALEGLQTSVTNLATTIPTSFEAAGEAVGEVNTRFGLVGEDLETLSGKFIKFADLNNTDVSSSIDNVQKVMEGFGMETEDADELLDALNKTGQDTGISMDTLESAMIKNAASLKSMGLNAFQSASFLGQVEKSGADTSTVMSGLTKALTNANAEGKALPEKLNEFQAVMNSSATEQEKLNAAIETFGKKAGPAIYEACKTGSLSFESLSDDATTYLGSVETTFENTLDPADQFQITMNKLKDAGSQVGDTLLKIAAPAVEKVGDFAQDAANWFSSLTEEQQTAASEIAIAFALGGPALVAVGTLVEKAGQIVALFGEIPGAAAKISGVAVPVGIAIGAFTLLKAGIDAAHDEAIDSVDGLREMLDGTAESTEALNKATGSLQQTISDTDNNIKDINGKASVATDLTNELYKLDSQTDKTIAEQARMKSIVNELNAMYPQLSLSIDGTTGSLTKGREEVIQYIEDARDLALLEAYTTGVKDSYVELANAQKALKDAQDEQNEAMDVYTKAYHAWYELVEGTPAELMAGTEAQAGWNDEISKAWEASETAKEALLKQNDAVREAEGVISDCEEEISWYTDEQERLEEKTKKSTTATEDFSEAVDSGTETVEDNTGALDKNVKVVADVAKKVAKAAADEIKAWDDLYDSTRESIQGQLGLFDEWEQNTELTFADMQKNLTSQIEGMSNYATNMEKLSAAAVESADPNFKALVQALADMGIDAAGEVDTLVKTMETDRDAFNKYVADYGGNYQQAINNVAKVETYIGSGFKTKTMTTFGAIEKSASTVWKTIQKAAKDSGNSSIKDTNKVASNAKTSGTQIQSSLTSGFENGFKTLPATAQTNTQTAVTNTTRDINGMKLEPSVSKIQVAEDVKNFARGQVRKAVEGVEGSVSKITGAKKAGEEAGQTASANMKVSAPMKVTGAEAAGKSANSTAEKYAGPVNASLHVTDTTTAARNAKAALENWFSRNPIVTKIKSVIETVKATKHAEGGFTTTEQLSWLSEGDKPEVVIPLDASKRTRAMTLYQQTGEILGVNSEPARTGTITLPDGQTVSSGNLQIGLDADKMYAAVAAGAEKGMENANVKIYVNNREAGRILKNMGVQFA